MEDERGTFRPVMARKEREREGKESSSYLTGSMGHGGDFLRLATASQLSRSQRLSAAPKPKSQGPGPRQPGQQGKLAIHFH